MCCRARRLLLALCLAAAPWAASAAGTSCPTPAPSQRPAPTSPAAAALERGNRHARHGEAAQARDAYREAERLARAAGDARLAVLAAANAARATLDAEPGADVAPALERVVAEAAGMPDLRARVAIHAARTLARAGHAKRAAELLERAGAWAEAAGQPRLRSYALGWRGGLYEQAGRLGEARTLTRQALLEAGRVGAPDAEYRWWWQLGRIERAAGDAAAATSDYRRAMADLDALRAELARGPAEEALAFRSEVAPVYLGLVDLLLARAAAQPGDAARQAPLGEARDVLEALKAAELRDYFEDPCLASQRATTPDAVPGAVVVYPVLLPDRVELIVSIGGELSLFRSPASPGQVADEAHALRRLLPKRTTRQYLRPAQALYEALVRPIEPALEGHRIAALVFVPAGPLRTIPFAALHDARSGQFLIEKVPVAIAPGLTLVQPRAIDAKHALLLAAGLSDAVQGFPALPAVDRELSAIDALFRGEKLENAKFTRARFEREIEQRPFEIVHVASHGEFAADASKSFVLAHDGPIPMDRLGEIVGRTRYRSEEPLELLVLSACQTAAGDDRAALGLAGVALRAGARSAIATLWSVSDEASARLVTEFYTRLREPGTSRARALQQAQLALLRDPAFGHPGFWSPFVLISSWL